jgi:hypothetical protein
VYTLATKSFDDLEIVLSRPQSGLDDNLGKYTVVGCSCHQFCFATSIKARSHGSILVVQVKLINKS